jgi:hypothetical protein
MDLIFNKKGCNGLNGPNCVFTTNSAGSVRLVVRPDTNIPQLTSENNSIEQVDVLVPCTNRYANRVVRAVGQWNNWVIVESNNVMSFDESSCSYALSVGNLQSSLNYEWKVVLGDNWKESFGCGNGNCKALTNSQGQVRYVFKPDSNQLSNDYNLDSEIVTQPAVTTTLAPPPQSSQAPLVSTTSNNVLTETNPVKPCINQNCEPCKNNFASRLVRATGDWTIDAGSKTLWNGAEPLGLMTFDENYCSYTLVLKNLKKNFAYKWKTTLDNSFKENYGCTGVKFSNMN